MKISYYILALGVLFVQPVLAITKLPLNRELVESLIVVMGQMDALSTKYPSLSENQGEFSMQDDAKLIAYYQSTKAYPEMKQILSTTQFSNLKTYLDVNARLLAGMSIAEIAKGPPEMRPDAYLKFLEKGIADLKKKEGNEQFIKSNMDLLITMKKRIIESKMLMKRASTEDKNFVNANFEWLQNHLPGYIDEEDNETNNN